MAENLQFWGGAEADALPDPFATYYTAQYSALLGWGSRKEEKT
tara:strand:+ start:324 stop:452 length:129 start_codon:yes stop_codon:yes gene_type:complete